MSSKTLLPIFLLATLSIALFLHGFFPVSQSNKAFDNKFPKSFENYTFDKSIHDSQITKTVLIVIDAIRMDFINPKLMPFLSKIANESGCVNKVLVESPTVTLPRIKALVTGSIPEFVDIIINLANAKTLEDSIIHSAVDEGKKIVFYGDNTWLKLFPHSFYRSEGTHSFFVKDFKEVDNNVTRNVDLELEKNDWDIMILHYLGLDHIGHVFGPFSSLVEPKLEEMDLIVKKIHNGLSNKNERFLLLVTGDHGMRDSGGHGGSTFPERNVPLVVTGLNCSNSSFTQTDISVNLAALLGIKIPSSNIGLLQTSLLKSLSLDTYLYYLMYNNLVLNEKIKCDRFDFASSNYFMYLQTGEKKFASEARKHFENCSQTISTYLIYSSSKQNLFSLIISMFSLINLLMMALCLLFYNSSPKFGVFQYFVLFLINLVQFFLWNYFSLIFVAILSFLVGCNIKVIMNFTKLPFPKISPLLIVLSTFILVHPITFASSSFVEEEHEFWYFILNFFILLNIVSLYNKGYQKDCINLIFLSAGLRFLRTINSTGNKCSSCPFFSDWLLKNENLLYLHIFFLGGLVSIAICLLLFIQNQQNLYLNYLVLTAICIFRLFDVKDVLLARLIWILILLNNLVIKRNVEICWLLIATFLLKPYNLFLISYCFWASKTLSKLFDNVYILAFSHLTLGNVLYFAQGHSNSFASVDISVGYIGLNSYIPILVILQVLCHTYAFPVFSNILLFTNNPLARKESHKVWTVLFLIRIYVMLTTCIIIFIQRNHLFIWSVFAPKLFIEASHSTILLIQFLIYNVIQRKFY